MIARVDSNGTDADTVAVQAGLRAFNVERIGPSGDHPVRFFLRNESGAVVGGVLGHVRWQWAYVATLWVAESHRGRGHGAALMDAVEQLARSEGCLGIYLDTFEFQARPFYERLGFRVFGTLDGYPPGYCQFHLVKHLQ